MQNLMIYEVGPKILLCQVCIESVYVNNFAWVLAW